MPRTFGAPRRSRQHRDEEAVGAVACRRQREIRSRATAGFRRWPPDGRDPDLGHGQCREIPRSGRETSRPAPRSRAAAASRWHRPAARPASPAARRSSRMRRCRSTSSSMSVGFSRHLASGLRRQVPLPLQGASTSTRSKLPAWRFTQGSRSLDRPRRSTLCTPARLSRVEARSTRPFSTSLATSLPLFFMAAASARVLPPAPAQKSTTRWPGLGIGQQARRAASPRPAPRSARP